MRSPRADSIRGGRIDGCRRDPLRDGDESSSGKLLEKQAEEEGVKRERHVECGELRSAPSPAPVLRMTPMRTRRCCAGRAPCGPSEFSCLCAPCVPRAHRSQRALRRRQLARTHATLSLYLRSVARATAFEFERHLFEAACASERSVRERERA